jgi:nicotinate-nucleotide--dimethylbenzimidazole phosphoribosyltransferase
MTGRPRPAASLDEMRGLIAAAPAPDAESGRAALAAARASGAPDDPAHAAVRRLAEAQGCYPPRLERPRIALFAAAHGVARAGDAASGPLAKAIEAVLERRAPVVAAARALDADLRLYELAWPRPCGDITREPAMTDDACAAAMAYGMMAVDDTVDLVCLSALGDEGAIAAAALGLALYGGRAEDWAGAAAAPLVQRAVARHGEAGVDALELLRRLGGEDVAAIAGAVVAARFARIPVILDGGVALAAAGVLKRIAADDALDHCFVTGDDGGLASQAFAAALTLPAAPEAVARDAGVSAVLGLRAALSRHLATS